MFPQKSTTMVVQPTREAHEALLKRVTALEEELKRVRMEKKETGRSPAEVELKEQKTRGRKASRNSSTNINNETTTLCKHKKLLGQEVETDDGLEWRVKWGQRGAGLSSLLVLICWVARQHFATIVLSGLTLVFISVFFYKNLSFTIAKRLLGEMNVVVIIILSLCNFSIEIARPTVSTAALLGLLYMLTVFAFAFIDAVKVKSRVFVIAIGTFFVLVNMYNIYHCIFGDWDLGVVLLKYTIQENEYTFMKRSTQRSIFIQVLLFSMSGIYTLFKDRKQELMIFATGNIYRETGTASKEVRDTEYSEKKIKSEKRIILSV